jgi:hypothetical protein
VWAVMSGNPSIMNRNSCVVGSNSVVNCSDILGLVEYVLPVFGVTDHPSNLKVIWRG